MRRDRGGNELWEVEALIPHLERIQPAPNAMHHLKVVTWRFVPFEECKVPSESGPRSSEVCGSGYASPLKCHI